MSLIEKHIKSCMYFRTYETLSGYAATRDNSVHVHLEESLRRLSLINNSTNLKSDFVDVTAKEVVLRRCEQTEAISFKQCYPDNLLKNCHKIGEGVFGEVFLCKRPNGNTSVLKIIPIEGNQLINGEKQKTYEEVLSEVVIAIELSELRQGKKCRTYTFNQLQQVKCVKGIYPERLLDLWKLYDETKGSENDCPDIFLNDQLYIVLELENGGKDLESYIFTNAQQALSVFKQIAFGLAVAEIELKFEHRDLHWGNVLISTVEKNNNISYCIDGRNIEIKSEGVKASIIDFTLSRVEVNGIVIFNDLSVDEDLFTAKGDYQFEVYRLMQESNSNEWQHFNPYTNIIWLHYILDKMINGVRYKCGKSKKHRDLIQELKTLKRDIRLFNSVEQFIRDKYL